ncbi:suppressor of tumorigenicity 7 protein homolog, partial [Clonorchis sinensis]
MACAILRRIGKIVSDAGAVVRNEMAAQKIFPLVRASFRRLYLESSSKKTWTFFHLDTRTKNPATKRLELKERYYVLLRLRFSGEIKLLHGDNRLGSVNVDEILDPVYQPMNPRRNVSIPGTLSDTRGLHKIRNKNIRGLFVESNSFHSESRENLPIRSVWMLDLDNWKIFHRKPKKIFEWWYFRKYGKSFIEQISMNHIYPLIGGTDDENDCDSVDSNGPLTTAQECKVWRNPYSLFRGAEYQRFFRETNRDPLTYYDMNLSAQDHQTFFTCEADAGRPEYELMQMAWRERNHEERLKKTKEALTKNPECATAMILLAEEECSHIVEVEKMYKQAHKVAEAALRRSQQTQNHSPAHEAMYHRDIHVYVFIRRRQAMCARKLGKLKEAIKMMKDLIKDYPNLNLFNIHENLIECYLAAQQYADAQAFLAKYDDIHYPKSATICYTAALLKARQVADNIFISVTELDSTELINRNTNINSYICRCIRYAVPNHGHTSQWISALPGTKRSLSVGNLVIIQLNGPSNVSSAATAPNKFKRVIICVVEVWQAGCSVFLLGEYLMMNQNNQSSKRDPQ